MSIKALDELIARHPVVKRCILKADEMGGTVHVNMDSELPIFNKVQVNEGRFRQEALRCHAWSNFEVNDPSGTTNRVFIIGDGDEELHDLEQGVENGYGPEYVSTALLSGNFDPNEVRFVIEVYQHWSNIDDNYQNMIEVYFYDKTIDRLVMSYYMDSEKHYAQALAAAMEANS